jgi:DNA-binding protein HU-beta
MMTKKEMVTLFAEKGEFSTKVEAERKLDVLLEIITEAVANGEEVRLSGFGTFSRVDKAERNCINPKTQEKMVAPAKKVVKFKVAKALADKVNE